MRNARHVNTHNKKGRIAYARQVDEMQSKYDFLIVGAGLFGAVAAHELAERGKRVLVVDKRGHTGGNLYCRHAEGIPVHAYGAHIFHTDKPEIWDYACKLGKMNHFINSPLARFGDRLYNLPFNMNTFHRLFGVVTPEEARERINAEIAADILKNSSGNAPRNLEEQALRTLRQNDLRNAHQGIY